MDSKFLENCETCSRNVTDCRWNADGSYLAFSSEDKYVKIGQLSKSSGSVRVENPYRATTTTATTPSSNQIHSVSQSPFLPFYS